MPPSLSLVLTIDVTLAPTQDLGSTALGHRYFAAATGGTFSSPSGLRGAVLPGGGDTSLIRPDGLVETQGQFTLKVDANGEDTVEGEGLGETVIKVTNAGLLKLDFSKLVEHGDRAGHPTYEYARCTPRFEATGEKAAWLNRAVFVGEIQPPSGSGARMDVYEVL